MALQFASTIEHTLLRPEATENQIQRLCDEAKQFSFFGVCVPPRFVSHASQWLAESSIRVVSVVGFPLGYQTTRDKVREAQELKNSGADELDMVIQIGALKEPLYDFVCEEIRAIVKSIEPLPLKVIIETCLLTDDEKKKASELVVKAGAHFVKTSTGFSTAGATPADIQLIRKVVGPEFGIKASGGIKTLDQALTLIQAGANRIGSSSSVSMFQEWSQKK